MKLILKIFISVIFITIAVRVPVYAYEINSIREELVQIGLSEEACDNVIDYINNIDNLDITDEKLEQIIEEGKNIYTLVGDKRSVNDFTIIELYNLYNDASKIANDLNIDLKYDFKEKKVTIKDKNTNNILFQGNPDELNTYYNNYMKIRYSNGEKSDLIADIKDIITNKEDIYNQQDNNRNNNDKLINVEETKQNNHNQKVRFKSIYYILVIVVLLLIYVLFRKRHFHIRKKY